MESTLMFSLAELVTFIKNNFWQIIAILTLLKYRRNSGIILLTIQLVYGYIWWVYLLMSFISIISYDTYDGYQIDFENLFEKHKLSK